MDGYRDPPLSVGPNSPMNSLRSVRRASATEYGRRFVCYLALCALFIVRSHCWSGDVVDGHRAVDGFGLDSTPQFFDRALPLFPDRVVEPSGIKRREVPPSLQKLEDVLAGLLSGRRGQASES